MSDPLVYDSRSVRFKSPYGAVPSGTQVTFTLRPLRSEGYSRGKLTARLELGESAASLCQRALAAGVKLRPVPPLTPGERPQVLFSISAIPREEIAPAVEALRACWLP